MINELQMLSRSLEANGIKIPTKHPWIEGVKKGEALLVNLDLDGNVSSLEFCSPEQVSSFWSIKESNKATFPKINVDPLWAYADKELLNGISEAGAKKDWSDWFQGMKAIICSFPTLLCKEQPEQIVKWKKDKWSRLYKFSHEVVLPHLSVENKGLSGLIHCFDSYEEFDGSMFDRLFIQIADILIRDLENGRLECFKFAQQLLIGAPGAKQQPQSTLIFNHDPDNIVVANEDEANALGKALTTSSDHQKKHLCPLTGEMTEEPTDKFPSPKLPIIGNAYLMAMNKDAPCHSRHGKIGADIFSASAATSSHLDNVIRYITADELNTKTWVSVTSGKWEGHPKKEIRDLLICYAEELPVLQNSSVALLMGGDSYAVTEARFKATSSIVCNAIEKHKIESTQSRIRIFVIRKISKGQSQVVLNDFYSFPELVEAVETWTLAAKNHPPFFLSLPPQKKGEKSVRTKPWTPFPADLPKLLQYQWIRGGAESTKLDGCSLVSAYDLFFNKAGRTQSTASQVLNLIIQRTRSLLINAGNAAFSTDYSIHAKKSILQAISFIGITLYKLGYVKENYMKSAGYNVGRLLSLADCLHKEYCKYIRKGDVPNNLIGNSLLPTVLDNPVRGIARLSERIAVYIAPFERLHGEQYKLAGWARKQMGIISEQLASEDLPSSTDDVLKAQILLGYLAHSES